MIKEFQLIKFIPFVLADFSVQFGKKTRAKRLGDNSKGFNQSKR